ncbi:MAG: SAM-dependent methyltransferase [Rhodospirillales bacterium]|nr:SAM-dependent methyltransferase [Alphaproteobacteria bacterium]MBL6948074.1 SAM-dependent methyltransferase [Rhodospirillales bacterium]
MDIAIWAMVLAIIVSIFASTMFTGASPVPTSASVRDTMLAMLPQRIDGPIYELGSGWGGLARVLAGRYPDSPVRGFEISLLPWAVSAVRLKLGGPDNLCFRYQDFNKADLSGAALVVCYLPGPPMEKLRPKLEAELRPGTLVLSNTFALRGWQAIDTRTAPDMYRSQVYLYRVE